MKEKGISKVVLEALQEPTREKTKIDKDGKIITKISTYSADSVFLTGGHIFRLLKYQY